MTPRDLMVMELVKDVLGPRDGPREKMTNSPLLEYLTGVLSPLGNKENEDPGDAVLLSGVESGEEDDIEKDVYVPPLIAPPLDPQHRPSSFGISFAIRDKPEPHLSICLTWGRYIGQKQNNSWKRKPAFVCIKNVRPENQEWWFTRDGMEVDRKRCEISLHMRTRVLSEGGYVVNLYLVNRIRPDGEHARVEDHLFQPQIRVVCEGKTELIPLARYRRSEDEADDEIELEFLYRHRRVMARGFLCSAVWKEIDSENAPECGTTGEKPLAPPFWWTDGEILPDNARKQFLHPDVRTEFVPLYHIPAPDLSWPEEYGPSPELRAGVLAEKYDPAELKEALDPLIEGYRHWLEDLDKQTDSLNSWPSKLIDRAFDRCRKILERMERSLELLSGDDDARLAFCFASKAMDLQAIWNRGSGLRWRPFQLGYILMVLESLIDVDSPCRDTCDLLWVPTGAGKTEAYLFLILFVLALRRRRAIKRGQSGAGVAVITRYTLRLLTIQQFRRLLTAIMAAEYLRVEGLMTDQMVGWHPRTFNLSGSGFIWGCEPFGAGLWVGGGVTPNRLKGTWSGRETIPGALDILRGKKGEGEPAQVITCPACGTLLAIPDTGLSGTRKIYLVVRIENSSHTSININQIQSSLKEYRNSGIFVLSAKFYPLVRDWYVLGLSLRMDRVVSARDFDEFWNGLCHHLRDVTGEEPELASFRASRPGYFPRWYRGVRGGFQEFNFEIICPAPDCPLCRPWCAGAPAGEVHEGEPILPTSGSVPGIPPLDGAGRNRFVYIREPFRMGSPFVSDRIPIQAFTVDEQIYCRVPSVVVATADKFARPAFEPRASALFGVVDHHHCVWGYYREGIPPQSATGNVDHPAPRGSQRYPTYIRVEHLSPPELIIQDELHLMEGPLGSLAGFYETAVAVLTERDGVKTKYIASTATIRNAQEQVEALFARKLTLFPAPGLNIDDRFFIREIEKHPAGDSSPGRLYVGICAPGRGPLTPLKHLYARLLQTAKDIRRKHGDSAADPYWTLVGYFNALRELGGARALCRQDIPARIGIISRTSRVIHGDSVVELSSRTQSTELPAILEELESSVPHARDILLTTSMFGTGVDISRLSLMVVSGQPKTTSSYIQATGRVGRKTGALVVTFFRAARPRDLNHYESFCGYHRQLHRYVEPVTVYPFSSGVLDRAGGPVSVFVLRNMSGLSDPWYRDDSAHLMASRINTPDVNQIPDLFESRAQKQPVLRRSSQNEVKSRIFSLLEIWQRVARRTGKNLKYVEYAIHQPPRYPVVLGDAAHRYHDLEVVYDMAPSSLRDIEEECSFEG